MTMTDRDRIPDFTQQPDDTTLPLLAMVAIPCVVAMAIGSALLWWT